MKWKYISEIFLVLLNNFISTPRREFRPCPVLPALHLVFFPSLSSALLLILFLLGLFGQSAKKERWEKPREGPATKGATKRELAGGVAG